jgi:hypothetical protein
MTTYRVECDVWSEDVSRPPVAILESIVLRATSPSEAYTLAVARSGFPADLVSLRAIYETLPGTVERGRRVEYDGWLHIAAEPIDGRIWRRTVGFDSAD